MIICQSNSKKWQDLRTLRLASIKESPESFALTLKQAQNISDRHWQALASGDCGVQFFIAYDNSEPAGIVGAMSGLCCELVALWVAPAFRECSIASSLVEAVKCRATQLEYSTVLLKVSKDNIAAYKLYKKCGFTTTRRIAENGKLLQELQWTKN